MKISVAFYTHKFANFYQASTRRTHDILRKCLIGSLHVSNEMPCIIKKTESKNGGKSAGGRPTRKISDVFKISGAYFSDTFYPTT